MTGNPRAMCVQYAHCAASLRFIGSSQIFAERGKELLLRPLPYYGLVLATVLTASLPSIVTAEHAHFIAPIWISNAVAVYFALRRPPDQTPPIIAFATIASFLAALAIGRPATFAAISALSNLSEILLVVVPLRTLQPYRDFTRPTALLWFYALAAGPAPLSMALIVSAFLYLVQGEEFLPNLVRLYAAHASGMIIVVPMLFTVRARALVRMFAPDQRVTTLLCIGTVFLSLAIYWPLRFLPLKSILYPSVLLLAFKRGFAGGAIGVILVAVYLLAILLLGLPAGQMRLYSSQEQILILEIFLAVMAFSVQVVGTALEERRRLEYQLAAATERAIVAKDTAEEANRMKSVFLATMSHELRTPLNAVIGFSEMMEGEALGPLGNEHYREYPSLIRKAGRHLLGLINDILDMSRIEAGKFELQRENIDCNDLVAECVDLVRDPAREGGIALVQDLPAETISLNADPRAIKQILLNLLSNAVKFTPAGGRVIVGVIAYGGTVVFTVVDTGVGIPSDQVYRLGNPFVQVRTHAGAAHEGTGLGLALVRSLTELHGGTFAIDSDEGQGTTVTIAIPMAQTQIKRAAA
jgi:signal transduction histidine kinase